MNAAARDGTAAGLRLLADLRAETERADSKASLLLGALSMTVGLLGGLIAARGHGPSQLSFTGAVLWWTAVTALAASLGSLLLAVLPRYGSRRWTPGSPLTYFGDIRRAARLGVLDQALAATESEPRRGLVEALAENSRIVGSKHHWIRVGLAAYGAGMALLLPALLLH